MKRYEFPTPRTAFGVAAIAMSALTMGFMVFLPASASSERYESSRLAAAQAAATAPMEASIVPARIDVVGERGQSVAFDPSWHVHGVVDHHS